MHSHGNVFRRLDIEAAPCCDNIIFFNKINSPYDTCTHIYLIIPAVYLITYE